MALLIRLLKGYLALVLVVLLLGITASAIAYGLRGRAELPSPIPTSELFGRGPTPTAVEAPFGPIYTKDEVLRSLASVDPCALLQPGKDVKFWGQRARGPHTCTALLGKGRTMERVELKIGTEPLSERDLGSRHDIGGLSANLSKTSGCALTFNAAHGYGIRVLARCRTIDGIGELVANRLTRPGGPILLAGKERFSACDLLRPLPAASLQGRRSPTLEGLDACQIVTKGPAQSLQGRLNLRYRGFSLDEIADPTYNRVAQVAGREVVFDDSGQGCFGYVHLWPALNPEDYSEALVDAPNCAGARELLKRVIHNVKPTPKPSPLQPIDVLLPAGSD